jgi:hypothetical protein
VDVSSLQPCSSSSDTARKSGHVSEMFGEDFDPLVAQRSALNSFPQEKGKIESLATGNLVFEAFQYGIVPIIVIDVGINGQRDCPKSANHKII